jgi:hypothetical protein
MCLGVVVACCGWQSQVSGMSGVCTGEKEWICTRRGRDPLFLEVPPVGVPMEPKYVLPPLGAFMQGARHLICTDCAVATSYEWSEIVQVPSDTPSQFASAHARTDMHACKHRRAL